MVVAVATASTTPAAARQTCGRASLTIGPPLLWPRRARGPLGAARCHSVDGQSINGAAIDRTGTHAHHLRADQAVRGHHGGMPPTHDVTNQVPPLEGHDVYGTDQALVEAVGREGAAWAGDDLHTLGLLAGTPEAIGWGFDANRYGPELQTFDRYRPPGRPGDVPPRLPRAHAGGRGPRAARRPVGGRPAGRPRGPGRQVRRVEPGRCRPRLPDLDDVLDRARAACPARPGGRVGAPAHGPHLRPPRRPRPRQARQPRRHGHDREAGRVRRAGQHHAGRAPGATGRGALTGHKWFCSAPMCDVFLMLAQAPGGLSCFLVPRWLPDGTRNAGSGSSG